MTSTDSPCLTDILLKSFSFGIIVVDANERILLWSGWVAKASGFPAESVIGRLLGEVFPEMVGGRVFSAVNNALRMGLPSILSQSLNKAPFPLFAKSTTGEPGQRLQQKVQVLPLRPDEQQRLCLIEIFDVSLSVHRESVLDEQRNITRALINATRESALLLDESGCILAINDIGAQRLKNTQATLVGKNFYEQLPPELSASRRVIADQVFRTGQPAYLEDTRDGIHFAIHVYPVLDKARKVVHIAIYATDVTETLQQASVDRLFHEIDRQILSGKPKHSQFQYVCQEVARIFDLPVVWIGQKNAEGSISMISSGGTSTDYIAEIEQIGMRWDNTSMEVGPYGSAIRSGQTQQGDHKTLQGLPCHAATERAGLHSFISMPLILRGEVFGCFTLLSAREHAFSQEATIKRLADIASRLCVAQERALDHEQLRLLQSALASAANGVFITDNLGRIQWLNDAFVRMTGYCEEEVLGATSPLLSMRGGDHNFFVEMFDASGTGDSWVGETVESRKDGSKFTVRQTITAIRNTQGEATHFISIIEDMTQAREAEARIHRLAHYDLLTDLPNRVLFNEHCHITLTRARRTSDLVALMFLDLDRFKKVNDTYGHDVGDFLLKQVAKRLTASVRESDIVARLAGDEFTVLLPVLASTDDAAGVAQKIITALNEPFDFGGWQLQSGASIGIAFFPDDATDEVSLLKCADMAMYDAKHSGRSRYSFYRDLAFEPCSRPKHG